MLMQMVPTSFRLGNWNRNRFSGMIYALIGLFAAYWRYMRKDIC